MPKESESPLTKGSLVMVDYNKVSSGWMFGRVLDIENGKFKIQLEAAYSPEGRRVINFPPRTQYFPMEPQAGGQIILRRLPNRDRH